MKKTLFVVAKSRRYSKKYSEMYDLIEFIDPDDGKLYKTYVSDSNYNANNWADLIEIMNLHPQQCIVIEGNFKPKKGYPDLINADSKFQPIANFERDIVLNEIWDEFYA